MMICAIVLVLEVVVVAAGVVALADDFANEFDGVPLEAAATALTGEDLDLDVEAVVVGVVPVESASSVVALVDLNSEVFVTADVGAAGAPVTVAVHFADHFAYLCYRVPGESASAALALEDQDFDVMMAAATTELLVGLGSRRAGKVVVGTFVSLDNDHVAVMAVRVPAVSASSVVALNDLDLEVIVTTAAEMRAFIVSLDNDHIAMMAVRVPAISASSVVALDDLDLKVITPVVAVTTPEVWCGSCRDN